MQNDEKVSILLKKLIKLQYNNLGDLANKLQIDRSTLTRKLQKPSRAFLIELKNAKVPIPDDMITPTVKSVQALISKDGIEGFVVKESNGMYDKDIHSKCREQLLQCLNQVKELKAENYDLKKQIEQLKKDYH